MTERGTGTIQWTIKDKRGDTLVISCSTPATGDADDICWLVTRADRATMIDARVASILLANEPDSVDIGE
jgi:hypothetical protein